MSVRRVYPEQVAPQGFLDGDPDPATEFAPAEQGGAKAETPIAAEAEVEAAQAQEPPPPPPRPEVIYDGVGIRTYALLYPLTIAGRKIRRLTIHPPTLWDIQDWAAGRLATNYELMARMVDMDPVAIGALRWPDVQALVDITTAMLPDAVREAIELSKRVAEPAESADGRR